MKNLIALTLVLFIHLSPNFSQVIISNDGSTPDSSAMLEVKSDSRGFLIPRLSAYQRDSIHDPAEGLMIYCTTTGKLNVFTGGEWYEWAMTVAPEAPVTLCDSCQTTNDCAPGETCFEIDGGSYCLKSCDQDNPCPPGYMCTEVGGFTLCIPNTSSCTCDGNNLGLMRECEISTANGTCMGTQTCDVDGWGPCILPDEICWDEIDNDCDGETDEGCSVVIEWGNIQFPYTTTTAVGVETEQIYGRVYAAGVTDVSDTGQGMGIIAQVGYGPDGSLPANDMTGQWIWFDAAYNSAFDASIDDTGADEYFGTILTTSAGTYDYAFRYSGNMGTTWLYCDIDLGSSDGYSPADSGSLSVIE